MKPVTQINFLSIKPVKVDEFFQMNQSYIASSGRPNGLISSRLYRSLDGKSAVRVSTYESAEAHKEIHESESLKQHIAMLQPLIESSTPALYEEVTTSRDSAGLNETWLVR